MTRPKPKRGPEASETPPDMFYGDAFTAEELALVATFVQDPTLNDEIWLQRVLNHRLFRLLDPGESTDIEITTLVKVALALGAGTGRVARLLRDKRALSGAAADGIAGAIAAALDELGTELGVEL